MKDDAGHRLQDGRYHPGSERSRNSQEHPDEGPLYVEPVVVVVRDHILRAGNHTVLVVAEPDAIQHQCVEPVYNAPKGVCGETSAPERRAAVDIAYQQPQHDAEDGHGCNLLYVVGHASGPIGLIHQPQRLAALYNYRRIVVHHLYRVPGHQEHEKREDRAGYEGFYEKDHNTTIFLQI